MLRSVFSSFHKQEKLLQFAGQRSAVVFIKLKFKCHGIPFFALYLTMKLDQFGPLPVSNRLGITC